MKISKCSKGLYRTKALPFLRWLTIQKIYFNRGQSYIALVNTFIMIFVLWGVWADRLPFVVTLHMVLVFMLAYLVLINKFGKLDFDKGVAKFEAEFGTRELNPFYAKLEQDIQKVIGLLEAQECKEKPTPSRKIPRMQGKALGLRSLNR